MSAREQAFERYLLTIGVGVVGEERENAQADFNAGWDAANLNGEGK